MTMPDRGLNPQDTRDKLVENASPTWSMILQPIAASALRHAATAAGVWLVARGVTDSSGASAAVGAVMTLGGLGWSWLEKYGAAYGKQALADASVLLHEKADAARASSSSRLAAAATQAVRPADRQQSTGG
jgi:hypothetical protein